MKKRMAMLVMVLGVLGLCASANAVPIVGSIEFTGTLDTSGPPPLTLANATGLVFSCGSCNGATAGPSFGDYSGVPAGTPVTFSNFTFAPFAGPLAPLWTFSIGPVNYSFTLNSLTVVKFPVLTTQFLVLSGAGIANITGFDPTPGNFSLTTQGPLTLSQPGATDFFSFSAQTEVGTVPEPGTLLLIGSGLTALALRRRRQS